MPEHQSRTNSERLKLLIAESDGFCGDALRILETTFDVELADLSRDGLLSAVVNVDVLWVRLRNMIDQEVIDAAQHLRAIATNTTGLNHVDVEVADSRGIRVVSLKGENDFLKTIRATAEHTIALTLALLRRIPEAVNHVQSGGWDRDQFRGNEIFEKTVGIIGYGRLGQLVAGYFKAFGAQVIVNSREYEPGTYVDGFPVVDKERLWRESDIVTLHANYEPENHQMVSSKEFSIAKKGCVFINTARGELVDEHAFVRALNLGQIADAAVDVVHNEQGQKRESNPVLKHSG